MAVNNNNNNNKNKKEISTKPDLQEEEILDELDREDLIVTDIKKEEPIKKALPASSPFLVNPSFRHYFKIWWDNYKLEGKNIEESIGLDMLVFLKLPKVLQIPIFIQFLRAISTNSTFVPLVIGFLPREKSHAMSLPYPLVDVHNPNQTLFLDTIECNTRIVELGIKFIETYIENNSNPSNV